MPEVIAIERLKQKDHCNLVARLEYSQLHVSQDDGMKFCLKNQTKVKQHTISKHLFSYQFPFDFCT